MNNNRKQFKCDFAKIRNGFISNNESIHLRMPQQLDDETATQLHHPKNIKKHNFDKQAVNTESGDVARFGECLRCCAVSPQLRTLLRYAHIISNRKFVSIFFFGDLKTTLIYRSNMTMMTNRATTSTMNHVDKQPNY